MGSHSHIAFPPRRPLPVRYAALWVLHRVIEEHEKADLTMDACQVRAPDRALLRELTYGVLRRYFSLEADVSRFCRSRPDTWTRLALILGAYQIRHMRIPDHAAVSETVAAIKAVRPRSAGFVNAVLRRVIEHPPPRTLKPHQIAELPRWLYRQWREAFGAETVAAFATHLQTPPKLCLAVFADRDAWLRNLDRLGITAEPGALSPYAVLLPAGVDVTTLPGYASGEFIVMDQAAQAAVLAMPAMPDDALIVDLCAAPGGKTALLARRFPRARIVAVERNARRIPRMMENIRRLRLANVEVVRADGARLPFADGCVDAILVDAPCSASGVIRRHPDAKFLHDAAAVERHAASQLRLARDALRVLKAHGPMIYAVCSIHPSENESLLDALSATEDFELLESRRRFPAPDHDGFFFALLRKSGW